MGDSNNVAIIKQLFQYYSEANMKGFMSLLSQDAVWIEPGDSEIPYSGTFKGLAEIGRMIGITAKNLRMICFKAISFCESDNAVTALGYNEAEVQSTGKKYKTDWVYAFTLADSKITQVQVYMDTLTIAKAFSGVESFEDD